MSPLLLLGRALAGELVVVVRDQNSGAPIPGAALSLQEEFLGQTDARGLITISIPDEGASSLQVLSIEHRPAVVVATPPHSAPVHSRFTRGRAPEATVARPYQAVSSKPNALPSSERVPRARVSLVEREGAASTNPPVLPVSWPAAQH